MERIGLVPGTEVGGYRVVGPLGRGGMGAVYRAVDGDGREVALKLLHPHLAEDDDARERLRREVATLQRVRHPGVARVLDAELDAGDAFVVTELVDGQDLAAHVRASGPLDAEDVVRLAASLQEALEVVHGAGVLHRDVTPSNVLMSDRGPVLIDFGIAQGLEDERVTSAGLVAGTPGYLAPELLEGEEPSTSSDWWGWAAVVTFAATGRAPFGTRPVPAVLARVRGGEPDLGGLEPGVAEVLRSALAVRPEDRTPPGEVVADLRGAHEGEPSASRSGRVARTSVLGPTTAAVAEVDRTAPLRLEDDASATVVVPPDGTRGADATATTQWTDGLDGADGDTTYVGDHGDDRYDDRYGYGDDRYDGRDDGGGYADGGWDEGDRGYDPALDDAEIPAAYLAPTATRRLGTIAAAGAALVALGAVRPGPALAVAVGLAVLARAAGVAVGAVHARRSRRGRATRADVGRAVALSPWYLLRGVLGVLPAALVAASTVVILGGVAWWVLGTGRWVLASPADGAPTGELPGNAEWAAWAVLAAVTAVGLLALWFGPMMRPTRLGARWLLEGLTPGRPGAVLLVSVALVVAAVLVALTLADRPDVVWWPLPGAPDLRDLRG